MDLNGYGPNGQVPGYPGFVYASNLPNATINDFDPKLPAVPCRLAIDNPAGPTTITGIKAGYDGQVLWIYYNGATSMTLSLGNTGSQPANRLIAPNGSITPVSLALNQGANPVRLVYINQPSSILVPGWYPA
jgi:hypothetical protein